MTKNQSEGRHRTLYFAAALFGGVLLAALLWLMIALGDCWASNDTPAQIQHCHDDKHNEMMSFLLIVSLMWIISVVLHVRRRGYAKRLALSAGPFAFLAVSVAAFFLR